MKSPALSPAEGFLPRGQLLQYVLGIFLFSGVDHDGTTLLREEDAVGVILSVEEGDREGWKGRSRRFLFFSAACHNGTCHEYG